MTYGENALLALNTINRVPTDGIPIGSMNFMEHSIIERLADAEPESYRNDPYDVYTKALENIGCCMVSQYIPTNPLTMGDRGYESHTVGAPIGETYVDGILIVSPESVAEHIESIEIPRYLEAHDRFDPLLVEQEAINHESQMQKTLGPNILKVGYGQLHFPMFGYYTYGYENYFAAFALFPELIDKFFSVQADYFKKHNAAVVKGYQRANLPLYHLLDHDMADSRGLLTGLKPLERSWLPCFERCIQPAVNADFTLLWHCDGNLMELIPPLLECGVNGFQGFQYEDGMDYISICKMKTKDGRSLVIEAGVSVTRELPYGSPADINNQIKFLVENGPKTGLTLQLSSSCTPGTPWVNIKKCIEALKHYKTHGRKGVN